MPKNFVQTPNKKSIDSVTNGKLLITKWQDKNQIFCASMVFGSDIVNVVNGKS